MSKISQPGVATLMSPVFLGLVYSLLLLTSQALGISQNLKVSKISTANRNDNSFPCSDLISFYILESPKPTRLVMAKSEQNLNNIFNIFQIFTVKKNKKGVAGYMTILKRGHKSAKATKG